MADGRIGKFDFLVRAQPVCGLLNLSIGVRHHHRRRGGEVIVAVDRVIKRGRNRPSCRITRLPRPRFTIRLADRSDFRSRPFRSSPPLCQLISRERRKLIAALSPRECRRRWRRRG